MFSAFFLSVALFGAGDPPAVATTSAKPALETYRESLPHTAKTADAQVRLALWCEAHGLTAERLKHLSLAVLYDPSNALARGLMGLVAYHGKWGRPEVVGKEIQNDPAHQSIIKEYLDRRARTPDTADAQMKLAAWCDEKGLKEQAIAHYTAVTRISPSHEAAWKHLGYQKQGRGWVKPEAAAAVKHEAAQQKLADKHWKPILEKLRDGLESKDAARRARAEKDLAQVTDPRAVPRIWSTFVRGSQRQQLAAVVLLGQIDGPSASQGLAVLAVFSPSPPVRERAIETLRRRDPRDVVGRLIRLVHKPYKYQVRHAKGLGSPGELFVEGERFNIRRMYENLTPAGVLNAGRIYTPDVPFDPFNLRNLLLASVPSFTTSPTEFVPANHAFSTYPFPVSPQSASVAAHAIAADPQNSAAILGQLINNPANRYAPPGYWFFPANRAGGVTAVTRLPSSSAPGPMRSAAELEAELNRVVTANRHAIDHLRVVPPSPSNPLHQAMGTARLENNPANLQSGIALEMMDAAQVQAAQRDLAIGLRLEAVRRADQDLEQRLTMDVQSVEAINEGIEFCNVRALPVLTAVTGQDLGVDSEKWTAWWADQLGYAYQSSVPETKPTYTDIVATQDVFSHSCFAANTLVQTIDGSHPIESIRIGDRVLSQGTSNGQLRFQPVIAIHHNPPVPTLRIVVGAESIVATGIHRFWVAGKGWTMARELKPGNRLRIVGGTVQIDAIDGDKTQAVYNLEVAENRDFFVGKSGLLVHDFSFVQPVSEPFDRQLELSSSVAATR
jgi:tetratricopeptide (TPR) repeat protein